MAKIKYRLDGSLVEIFDTNTILNIQSRLSSLESNAGLTFTKLWSGSLTAGNSITIPGLSGAKSIGIKCNNDTSSQIQQIQITSGELTFNFIQPNSWGESWDLICQSGKIEISGTTLTCIKCTEFVARSTSLSDPFTLVGGENTSISEIWRIG